MLNRFTTLWIWGLFLTIHANMSAQVLTAERHTPCFRDSIEVHKMPYTAVGDSGRNCVWDFSNLPVDSAEVISLDYYATSSSDTMHIGLHREHANYYYHYANDTLWLTGFETSRTRVHYNEPVPWLRYPFAYGDSVIAPLLGTGQYCHRIPLSVEGKTIVRADACGRLLLPDMSVDSVLRVHSTMQYVERLQGKSQIQEDRYQWYSATCRYPLLETVCVLTVKNADTVSFASTYYFQQEEENVPVREQEQPVNQSEDKDSLVTDVTYLPNPVFADLNINYTLVRAAQVYISLHYNGGATTYQTPTHDEEEGAHSAVINMSGLPVGTYAVYIHADDTVVSGNVIKL